MDCTASTVEVSTEQITILCAWMMTARPSAAFEDCVYEAVDALVWLHGATPDMSWRVPEVGELARALLHREPSRRLAEHFERALELRRSVLPEVLRRGGEISTPSGSVLYLIEEMKRKNVLVTQVVGDLDLYREARAEQDGIEP